MRKGGFGLAAGLTAMAACSGGVVPNPGGRAPLPAETRSYAAPIVSLPVPALNLRSSK